MSLLSIAAVKNIEFDDAINDIATSLYKEGYSIERRDIVREPWD